MSTYVANTAVLKCTFGDQQSQLGVLPSRTIFLNGQPKANVSDHRPMVNIRPFGKCHSLANPTVAAATAAHHGHLTPMPCVPNTPSPWMQGKTDVIEKGDASLKSECRLQCMWAGIISIKTDGQTGVGCQATQKDEKLQIPTEEKGVSPLDVIQTALDVAGFVPMFGAIPDLVNAGIYALRGDMLNAGLSVAAAVPGAGDVAGAVKLLGKGAKATKEMNKTAKAIKTAEKTLNNGDDVVRLAEKRIVKEENVTSISSAPSYKQRKPVATEGGGELIEIKTTVKKQANGVTIEERQVIHHSETVTDSIDVNTSSFNGRNPFGHGQGSSGGQPNSGGEGMPHSQPPNSIFDNQKVSKDNVIKAEDRFKSPKEISDEIEKTQKEIDAIKKYVEKGRPQLGKKIDLPS